MLERAVSDIQIKVDGAPLETVRLGLISVSINDDLRMASSFSLQLHSWDMDLQRPTWIDDKLFALGKTVEISLGYVGAPMQPVITGEVTDLDAEFDLERPPTLTVTGYDFRQRLGRNTAIETYPNMTDSQIAEKIIQRNKLTADVTATSLKHEHVTQNNESDLEFLHKLAKHHGFDVMLDGAKVQFGLPKRPKKLALAFGKELLGFSATISGSELYDQVEVHGVDLTQGENQQEFTVSAKVPRFAGVLPFDEISARTEIDIYGPPKRAKAELLAKNRAAEIATSGVSASGRCRGNGQLRAGVDLEVSGLGDRFSGNYRVTSVSHSFSPEAGFMTSFRVTGSPP